MAKATDDSAGTASGASAEFDAWAEYYDLIHDGLPGEAEFYVGQAVRIGGKTLELGCGTGRIAIPMAMSGVHVTGLDNSEAMLRRCREKLCAVGSVPGTLTLVRADMADFKLHSTFSFVAMAYRTFMHLLTSDDQQQCLSAVHHHLDKRGVFILNCWVPKPSQLASISGEASASRFRLAGRYPIPGTTDVVIHHHAATCDESRQLLIERHKIQEVDAKGAVLEEVTLPLTRAWIMPHEMNRLVRRCGFKVDAIFGDFDCHPFTQKSSEMIWVLRKG